MSDIIFDFGGKTIKKDIKDINSEEDLKKALEQSIEESFKQIKDKYKESNDVSTGSDNKSI